MKTPNTRSTGLARSVALKVVAIAEQLVKQGPLDQATLFAALRSQGLKVEEDVVFFSEPTESEESRPQKMADSNSRIAFICQHIIEDCVLVCFKQQPDPDENLLLASYLKLSKTGIAVRICNHADEKEPILSSQMATATLDSSVEDLPE